jgi:cell fate regulator YaaT (PSP1 superfamily)
MPLIVGVSFRPVTKIYYFDPARVQDLQQGEYVIVDTARGREVGCIALQPRDVPAGEIGGALKQVVRRATAWDMVEKELYRQREAEALVRSKQKAAEHNLPMKLVRTEYNFDGGRLVIYFTSDKRVDFRGLVRDLARIFRCRIEMRQIGVRDQAKLLDGMGKCGRRLCCSSWLREFAPVSIKMAKQQNLPLNPTEISGVCGRLLCCLSYENETYDEVRNRLPKLGSNVLTKQGTGKVRKVNALQETMFIQLEDESIVEMTMADILENRGKDKARTCGTCGGCSVKKRPAAKGAPAENGEESIH